LKDNFQRELIVTSSASRHSVSEIDAIHAYRNAIVRWTFDEEFEMVVGADTSGRMLEVGLVRRDGALLLIHAMPARAKYLRRSS
jgi:hypothetical protein